MKKYFIRNLIQFLVSTTVAACGWTFLFYVGMGWIVPVHMFETTFMVLITSFAATMLGAWAWLEL